MTDPDNEPNSSPVDDTSGGPAPDKSLTLKDYLETATDASRRTRFITIVMVVASVLVLVSVLNSSDYGWITLRLNALSNNTSKYTVRKFPLLCKCDSQVIVQLRDFCVELEREENVRNSFWMIYKMDSELALLGSELSGLKALEGGGAGGAGEGSGGAQDVRGAPRSKEISDKETELKEKRAERQMLCNEERERLDTFNEMLLRTAAETKYTVRAPFFGVAFDINDVGFLGGLSLWIILILLRLSLRSQIVSLRIGFKAARASGRDKRFYEILAGRQVFVFPYLEDENQQASVAMGWTERLWRISRPSRYYKKVSDRVLRRLGEVGVKILTYLEAKERAQGIEGPQKAAARSRESALHNKDPWRVNRNTSLRVIPKLLCLLPFAIYAAHFWFDVETRHYGNELDVGRTRLLLGIDLFFLLNILGFGLWCVTKWNELDKLWDYFESDINWEK